MLRSAPGSSTSVCPRPVDDRHRLQRRLLQVSDLKNASRPRSRSAARRRCSVARRPLPVDARRRPSAAARCLPPAAAALAAGGVFSFLGKKVEHPITVLQQHTKISVHPQVLFGTPAVYKFSVHTQQVFSAQAAYFLGCSFIS
ncbi:hypothetical protein ACLOJK_012056 [Asimina triloba]